MAKMERGLTLEGLRGNVPAEKLEAGDVARVVVPEEDDKYKVLSPRYKPTKKRNKSKKSKRSKNSGGGPLADEEFTQPASSQTKHADEKKEEAAQEDRGTHSTPIDAVAEESPAAERKLRRWHTLGLARKKIERQAVKEGDLVWRQSRKETQHVALSLTATILWIKKANKEFFSPFLEIINISNVYMKKDVVMMVPPPPLGAAQDSGADRAKSARATMKEKPSDSSSSTVDSSSSSSSGAQEGDKRRKSLGDLSEARDQLEGEASKPTKTGSRIGSAIKRGSTMTLRRTPAAHSAGPQPVAFYSFVIEVRRKEFTTNVITQVFASESKQEIEAWVTALHEVIIAARLAKRKSLLEERALEVAELDDDKGNEKGKEKEKAERPLSPRAKGGALPPEPPPEPTFQADLLTGLSSVVPGETEKQRARRLKQEIRDELQERKRRGKAEAKLTLFGLVTSKGYPIEEHKVTTPDGYILTLHRIPHGKNETGYSPRPVVFLMHGLMDCSVTWIVNETAKCLGFIFADNGFDVWMGNVRGNRFSREHAHFKVDSTQYWNFNRDDLVKDARASIDYALDYAHQPHLVFVGHSQGCNVLLAMMATQPETRSKISIGLLLAPAAYVHNQKSKMMTYLANMQTDKLFQFMGIKAFLTTGTWLNNITPGLLLYSAQGTRLVTRLIFDNMCGWNPDNNFSLDRMPVIAAHQPGGTSVMVMAHWAQSIRNGTFSHFDYGAKKNLEVYGQEQPPPYDLGSIHPARLGVFYGGEDKLTCKEDVERLLSELPEETVVYAQFEEEYGHLDFVWGDDAHIRIYLKLVELAKKHYKLAEKRRRRQEQEEQEHDKLHQARGEGEEDKDDSPGASSSSSPSPSSHSGSTTNGDGNRSQQQPQQEDEDKAGKKDKKEGKKKSSGKKKTKKAKSKVDHELVRLESNADLCDVTSEAVPDAALSSSPPKPAVEALADA